MCRTPGSTFSQKSVNAREGSLVLAGHDDLLDGALPDVPHGREPVPHVLAGRREVLHRLVHVRRQDPDAHQARRVQVEGLVVLVVLDAGQQRRHVLQRVVPLQVRGLVPDEGVRARVRRGEPVVGEGFDPIEQILAQLLRMSLRGAPGDEPFALGADELALLLRHDPSQLVGLSHRVAGDLHGDLHDLLLVDHDPVGIREDVLQVVGCGYVTGRRPCLRSAYSMCMPGAERPRTVQRVQGHQVLEPVGLELLDQRAHAAALQLEHADGVAPCAASRTSARRPAGGGRCRRACRAPTAAAPCPR